MSTFDECILYADSLFISKFDECTLNADSQCMSKLDERILYDDLYSPEIINHLRWIYLQE